MLFKQVHLDGIKSGEVSLAFRRWKKASVKQGSLLKTAVGLVEIVAVSMVAEHEITPEDALAAGYAAPAALLRFLRQYSEGDLYKITVRYYSEDPRIALREQTVLPDEDFTGVQARLDRLDRHSATGPWTRTVLHAIRQHPRLKAADLAALTGREKEALKLDVRKLKNLGLTISHNPGYELSPLGKSFLSRERPPENSASLKGREQPAAT